MLRLRVARLTLAGVVVACGEPGGPVVANLAPVASAGGPYVTSILSVTVTGAASTDPDSNLPLAYAWDFGDGATGSGEAPTHAYAEPGSYQVTLRVTDSRGAVSEPSTTSAAVTPRNGTILTVAGNIASCGNNRDAATAALLDGIPGWVAALGDNAFPDGTMQDYTGCYGPTWGRHKDRTFAVLGNHDYQTGDAAGAFDYFGDRAGPRALGYYSFELDAWHVIVLNDNAPYVEFGAGSPQDQWLVADLAANPKPCVLAMWHQPRFTSSNEPGAVGRVTRQILWQRLYDAGAEIVLNGQEHQYERLRPMTPDGTPDDVRGIRQFNVGTGGESVALPTVAIHPQSEILAAEFGVLTLTLAGGGYAWEFIPVPGSTFSDSGLATCH